MAEDLYTMGIRKSLNDKGITNERIGYDQANQYVTIDGQKAIKSFKNDAGSTFTSPTQFGADYGAYDLAHKTQPVQTSAPITAPVVTTPYVNPVDSQVQDILKQIMQRTTNPVTVDPYGTPQYAAAQAQVQQGAQKGIRSAQESLGGSGLARSSIITDRAQGIQNDATNYLQTQLLPQIQQQLQAQEDQKTQGLRELLSALSSQQGLNDNRHQADIVNANNDRTFEYNTGRDSIADTRYANETDYNHGKDLMDYQSKADETAYNREKDLIERNSKINETAYNHARDSLLDKRYETEFKENVKQQGFENALKIALQKHQISNDNAQIAISRQNASTSAASQATSASNSINSQSNAELDNARADKAAVSKTYQDNFSSLMSLYTAKDSESGAISVTNPDLLRSAIIAKNMDDDLTIQMLTDFGLPVKKGG